ncbi:MAG: acyl-CoA dehydrogenase family protein, partial [Myxococcales bacterium]|nr:acyl-CoA dehydrogenase family protein [Myxococcales bacterium]
MIVLERFGRTLVPEPYVPSIVLAGYALHKAGTAQQHERFLTPLLAGDTTFAVAYAEAQSRGNPFSVHTTALRDGAGFTLQGEKVWVLNGHAANHLLVTARTGGEPDASDGVSLFIVDPAMPGVTIRKVGTMDGARAAMVSFDSVQVGPDRLLGKEGAAGPLVEELMDRGAAAACCEGAGNMQA